MIRFWNYIVLSVQDGRNDKGFLAICAGIPGAVGLVIALLGGLVAGMAGIQLIELVFTGAGYPGLIGFLVGILHLYNR